MENPWVIKGGGKGNIHRGRGRSSPRGMSLYNLNSRAQEKASSLIHLEDIPKSDPLYAQLQEFITQKQSDTFDSIAKEDVDDIKMYEKRREESWKIFQRYLVNGLYFSGESYKTQKYYETLLISTSVEFQQFSGYNTSENVYNFSKMIIKHVIHIEDWGISSMTERQFSLNKVIVNFTYWDYIQAFNKSYHGPTIKILPKPFLKLYRKWIKISPVLNKILCSMDSQMGSGNPQTKSIYGKELLDLIIKTIKDYKSIPNKGIIVDDSTSVKHMARKISNHDEEEQDEIIMKYLEEVKKKILLNLTHYAKLDSSMHSETSEDMHEAQPYEEKMH
ncbi:hypothetical protein H5410_060904 [Solanum commersonii]|uniref:Uncharacterized protein n=1 Tax=Solanum commersonii TaxID=4109 RepID=A0A9J5W6H9_SOLCO|nr:hypothetical protein H5410_060904 [Solanum commersonii]